VLSPGLAGLLVGCSARYWSFHLARDRVCAGGQAQAREAFLPHYVAAARGLGAPAAVLLRPLRERNPFLFAAGALASQATTAQLRCRAGNACVASLLAQSVLGAFGFGSSHA